MSNLSEGFGERSQTQFWRVKSGLLCKGCTETTDGAIPQKKDDGTIYHELQRSNFTGRLRKVEVRTHEEYGKFLALHFLSSNEPVKIECKFDSGYSFGFLTTIPSAKIDGLIMIAPYYKETDGKKESKIFIKDESCQGKEWCKQYFTKDNPNGMPGLEKVTFKGKESWDNSKRLAFFENELIPKLNAKLDAIWNKTVAEVEPVKAAPVQEIEPSNELPF
jgi:hypothetical protein